LDKPSKDGWQEKLIIEPFVPEDKKGFLLGAESL
jgi:hypothetical protein